MSFWKRKKVLVTGGTGFIGSAVAEKLIRYGAEVTLTARSKAGTGRNTERKILQCDCTVESQVMHALRGQDIVINLAALVAGIAYNRTHNATMLRDNMAIASTVLEAVRKNGIGRFLFVSSACVYPHDASIPTPESEGMMYVPEETNSGYGWAKRYGEILSAKYAEEFGMNIGVVRPYNAYGPRDHFNDTDSHVIPSLITRIVGGEDPLVVWGSGKQSRSFLYVEDLADGILKAVELYPVPDPINLGSDEEITIADLVDLIRELSGKEPKVTYDVTKPDGSPRRKSDNTKAQKILGFTASTSLRRGLEKTIEWYINQMK
jgi:GDP-L-fucose synthase